MKGISLVLKVVFVGTAVSLSPLLAAQQPASCLPNSQLPGAACAPAQSVIVRACQPQSYYYCGKDGKVHDLPIHLTNASSLTIVVEGINPVSQNFAISFQSTKYAETEGSALLGFMGLQVPSAGSPAQPGSSDADKRTAEAQETTPLPPSQPSRGGKCPPVKTEKRPLEKFNECKTHYEGPSGGHTKVRGIHDAFQALVDQANAYRDRITDEQNLYNETVAKLKTSANPNQDDFQTVANRLKPPSPDKPALLNDQDENRSHNSYLTPLIRKPLDEAADNISNQAVDLHGSLAGSVPDECRTVLAREIDGDLTSLGSIFQKPDSSPSLVDSLKTEVTSANNIAVQLALEEPILKNIVSNPNNYELDATIPPEDRVQTSVAVTVSWTARDLSGSAQQSGTSQPQTSPSQQQSSAAQSANNGNNAAQPTQKDGSGQPNASPSGPTTFTLKFGQGPRTFESAGLVFSPLAQHSYSTATAGSSSSCPSAVGTVTQAGCIVDNGGAGWRILPMALATVRFSDVAWSQWRTLVPNYFSFGATIKSNSSSGTNLEYLAGLSWTTPGQHVFFTAGGYAGEVTQLAGGLSLGPQAVEPPTTLPTSTPYRWGFGFAISYKIGSQGGNGNNVQGQSPTGGT